MNIGVDLGRSSVKLSSPNGELQFPSLISIGGERITYRNQGFSIDELDVTIDNIRYFCGKLAANAPISFSPFDKSHVNEYTKVFLLAALSLLDDESFNVVIGLPIADFATQKKDLAATLRGDYSIKCADRERRIIIRKLSVFPQGLGGLFSQYLSYNGGLIKGIPELVGVVDIGYKDCNFALLRNGEVDLSASWSIPQGLHSAFIAALPEITKEYDYKLHEIKPEMIPQKYYDELKELYVNQINQFWPKQKFPVFSCGGGSHWVDVNGSEQMSNPVFANAIGFRKLANLKWP